MHALLYEVDSSLSPCLRQDPTLSSLLVIIIKITQEEKIQPSTNPNMPPRYRVIRHPRQYRADTFLTPDHIGYRARYSYCALLSYRDAGTAARVDRPWVLIRILLASNAPETVTAAVSVAQHYAIYLQTGAHAVDFHAQIEQERLLRCNRVVDEAIALGRQWTRLGVGPPELIGVQVTEGTPGPAATLQSAEPPSRSLLSYASLTEESHRFRRLGEMDDHLSWLVDFAGRSEEMDLLATANPSLYEAVTSAIAFGSQVQLVSRLTFEPPTAAPTCQSRHRQAATASVELRTELWFQYVARTNNSLNFLIGGVQEWQRTLTEETRSGDSASQD